MSTMSQPQVSQAQRRGGYGKRTRNPKKERFYEDHSYRRRGALVHFSTLGRGSKAIPTGYDSPAADTKPTNQSRHHAASATGIATKPSIALDTATRRPLEWRHAVLRCEGSILTK